MSARKFLNWIYSHGVLLAYGAIITVVLAVSAVFMMGVVLFAHWWDRIK